MSDLLRHFRPQKKPSIVTLEPLSFHLHSPPNNLCNVDFVGMALLTFRMTSSLEGLQVLESEAIGFGNDVPTCFPHTFN